MPDTPLAARPRPVRPPAPPVALWDVVHDLARDEDLWSPHVRFDPERRWYRRLAAGPGWQAWLLTWLPGQRTGLHDHGPSAGAFAVLRGAVVETAATGSHGRARLAARTYGAGAVRSFGRGHLHDVAGAEGERSVTLHVYGPALERMSRYAVDPDGRLHVTGTEQAGADW